MRLSLQNIVIARMVILYTIWKLEERNQLHVNLKKDISKLSANSKTDACRKVTLHGEKVSFSITYIPSLPRYLCTGTGLLTSKSLHCCNSSCCLDTCYSKNNKFLQ